MDNREMKEVLATAIEGDIFRRGLTQTEIASLIGSRQGEVSAIVNKRLDNFSIERLITYCDRLGLSVTVEVLPPLHED